MRTLAWVIGLSAFSSGFVFAQSNLTFEVASVKPAAPQANGSVGMRGGPGSRDPGRIAYTNVTLKNVLVNAYDVLSDQISGPNWLDSSRYDIDAKIPADTTREQFRVMLQNLLAERFHLRLHREKKDFPVYELVVAKGGPKLKRSTADRDSPTPPPASNGRGGATDPKGFPLPGPHSTAQTSNNGVANMSGNQITMIQLAQFLKFPMGFLIGNNNTIGMSNARVVDKTGLDGEYDVTLEYEWPGQVVAPAPGTPGGPADLTQAAEPAPVLFTALQQQLGLRLEQTKEPFEILIIDYADKTPTEN